MKRMACLTLALACASLSGQGGDTQTPGGDAASEALVEDFVWLRDLGAARRLAKTQRKPLLLTFR